MGTRFLWDPVEDNIVKELDDSNAVVADYTTEPYLYGDLISQDRDGQSRFYHFDGQGSTMELTDSGGNVTDTRRYSAFGVTIAKTGNDVFPFQYIGKTGYCLSSTTDQYDSRYRLYDTRIGRWLTVLHKSVEVGSLSSGYAFVLSQSVDRPNANSILPIVTEFERPIGTGSTNPEKYKCGQMETRVQFTLKSAPCNGYLIQHITVKVHIEHCKDHSKCPGRFQANDIVYDYYEMFPADPFNKGPWIKGRKVADIDTRRNNGGLAEMAITKAGNCGKLYINGVFRFYCAADILGKEDPSRWPPGGGGPSGQLPSTKNRPVFWTDLPAAEGSAGIGHSWCCCALPLIHSESLRTQETTERHKPVPHEND